MYERLLDKNSIPAVDEIVEYIGAGSFALLGKLETELNKTYPVKKELRFPFGNNYGWGYKYSCKSKHICYLFFEKDSFTVMIQLGDGKAVEEILENCLPKTKELWEKRYPCSNGGWVHYRVLNEEELQDVIKLIHIKMKKK